MEKSFGERFERLIKRLLALLNYETENVRIDWAYIILIANGNDKKYVDVKFYRSKFIGSDKVRQAAKNLSRYINEHNKAKGILIVNNVLGKHIQDLVLEEYNVEIWDRKVLYYLFSKHSIELRDEFERLLLEAQQGTNTIDVFQGFRDLTDEFIKKEKDDLSPQKFNTLKEPLGTKLSKELDAIPCGKDGWSDYEKKGLQILKYLFDDDLSLWSKQARTDDGLSRFDLICRIASNDDYWKALIHSYNSRFVLFEFKNYCKPINQGQIYTTERYLFIKALRSVAYVIARNGASKNAIIAAKGALKENGKLILLLDNSDLKNMLSLKDSGGNPSDYLSDLLDNWLVSLSR